MPLALVTAFVALTLAAYMIALSTKRFAARIATASFRWPLIMAMVGSFLLICGFSVVPIVFHLWFNPSASRVIIDADLFLLFVSPFIILTSLYWAALLTKHRVKNITIVTMVILVPLVLYFAHNY